MRTPADIAAQRQKTTAVNPFVQTIFTADPSAHVFNDRLYVYPSHDIDPARGCDLMDRYHVYSTADMVNWRDEGEIVRADDVAWGRPAGGFMWAPDCGYANGQYYFYFPHPRGDNWHVTWEIGVATSKYPNKGFQVVGYLQGLGGWAMNDPCIFIDDDGTPYLYHGDSMQCKGSILNSDMVSVKTGPVDMVGLADYHEATWVFKRQGIYYLTYSDNASGNNHLCYATSTSPLGPWESQGPYLDPTNCETSHGSVIEFHGDWYAFYHSDNLSGNDTLRSIQCDRLTFTADGKILPVVQTRNSMKTLTTAPPSDPSAFQLYAATQLQGTVPQKPHPLAYKETYADFTPETSGTLTNIDGQDGDRLNIGLCYGTANHLAKAKLMLNGRFETLLNLPYSGALHHCTGYANITVRLRPGQANTITVVGNTGEFSIDAITIENYDHLQQ